MKTPDEKPLYEKLGASATKAGLHTALATAGLTGGRKLFAKVNDDFAGDQNYYSFVHCDGAGTKSLIAYLAFRETNDHAYFRGLSNDALVMNLDDIFCLGIPDSLVLANALARNARLIDDQAIGEILVGYRELTTQLNSLGIPIALSGGETADCGDVVRTLLVDAVVAGRIRKDAVIDPERIVPGDVIVGLSSTGKATYETQENSGVGSNGLTLARHTLLSEFYRKQYPEAADPLADPKSSYFGPFRLLDAPAELRMTVAQALLSPTRSYAPVLQEVYRTLGKEVHGAIHVTGGGLTKVMRFGPETNLYVKNHPFPTPPLFALIQKYGDVSWKEMYQVFNMGQRFELYLPEKHSEVVIRAAKKFNIAAQVIGQVEKRSGGERVRVESPHGTFSYLSDNSPS